MWQQTNDPNKHNLPSQPTLFIGRKAELIEINELLTDPACRLLTLCGPGGIGKTRLAIEAGIQSIAHFPDGVWMTDLEPLTAHDDIIPAVITALGLQLQGGHDLQKQLIGYLSKKRILLIMDNFEHLLDSVGLVTDLLEATPGLTILVTSRETLKLREEWVRYIRGLDVPKDEQVANLENYSAVQLFVEGARRVRGDFSLADEQACVVRLCQIVEGLPLALELAATWLKMMPCAMIITEIQSSLDLLESPLVNMPARHRSMRAIFDQSWRLLSEKEQSVFKKLAVFRDGFLPEAAVFVSEASVSTLYSLVSKALLYIDADGRYHLHSLVRQYAEEKLNESTEGFMLVCDQHCHYYTEFLYERRIDVWRTNSLELRHEIGAELDNIRRALDWALEQRDIIQIGKAAIAYTEVCYQRSLWREGYIVFGRMVALARSTKDDSLLWRVVASQGWFAHCLSDFEQAAQLYEEALTIGRQVWQRGDVEFKDFMMLRLSEMAMRQGDLEKAREYAKELAEPHDLETSPLWTLETLGRIEYLACDYQMAKKVLQKALTMARTSNNVAGIVVVANHLGYVYLAQGEYTAAQEVFSESIERGQAFDYQRGAARSLVGLGFATSYLKENDAAWSFFAQALEKARKIGDLLGTLNAIIGIAELLATEGDEDHALELLAYVQQHSAADWEAHKKAEQLLNNLESTSSAGTIAQAEERAKTLELNSIVDSLLAKAKDNEQTTLSPKQILAFNQSLSEPLTRRELEVLELIISGHSNRQVADQLVIGISTVKKHITHIFGKLDVSSRTQAINRFHKLQQLQNST